MPSLPPTGLPQDVVRPGTDDIVTSPGYHSPSKLYLAQRGSARVIKPAPTLADAQTGAQMLMRPFASFPWADEQQRGVVLLAALLAVFRQMFAMAPGVAISAPVASSGKTLASQVLAILATGSEVPVYTMPPNLDEQEKRLLGMFLGGRRAFILDNITSRFDSSALNAAMTSEFWESRILAQSKTTRVSTRVLILANGNNLSMAGDV